MVRTFGNIVVWLKLNQLWCVPLVMSNLISHKAVGFKSFIVSFMATVWLLRGGHVPWRLQPPKQMVADAKLRHRQCWQRLRKRWKKSRQKRVSVKSEWRETIELSKSSSNSRNSTRMTRKYVGTNLGIMLFFANSEIYNEVLGLFTRKRKGPEIEVNQHNRELNWSTNGMEFEENKKLLRTNLINIKI